MVIGIGNEHRGDDAAGLLVIRELRMLLGAGDSVDLVEHHGEGASLIELWSGRDRVTLVDAIHSGKTPGRVLRLDAGDRPIEIESEHGSTHAFGLAAAIEMARCLDRLPPRVEVYGITGSRFTMGAEPQPAVRRAARTVARSIAREWPRPRPS